MAYLNSQIKNRVANLTLVVCLLGVPAAYAEHAEIDEILAVKEQLRATDRQMDELRSRLFKKTTPLARRGTNQGGSNPIAELRWQAQVKEAHALALELNRLENRRRELLDHSSKLSSRLLQAIDERILALSTELSATKLPADQRRQLSQELAHSFAMREQFDDVVELNLQSPTAAVLLPTDKDTREDLRAKFAVLADSRDQLQTDIASVRTRLARIKRQTLIAREVSQLMQEESFFAETRFAKLKPYAALPNLLNSKSGGESTIGAASDVDGSSNATGHEGEPPPQSTSTGTQTATLPDGAEETDQSAPLAANLGANETAPSNGDVRTRNLYLETFADRKLDGKASPQQLIEEFERVERELLRRLARIEENLAIADSMMRLMEQTDQSP